MLSIRSTKQKFSLGLRAADGQETVFYTYDPGLSLIHISEPTRPY